MSNHCLSLESALSPAESARIDAWAAAAGAGAGLPGLAALLRAEVGLELSLDPDIVAGFRADSSNLPGEAGGVARPESERQCAALLSACFRAGIPVTVSGGRSNLTGSATPRGGIILSTVRMLSPAPQVDEASRSVRAPVGMILEDLRREVLRLTEGRLHFPVNPTSRADAQVGGAIACNASGFTPGEIGAIRSWVLTLDFLLPDGRTVRAARGQYRSEGGRFELPGDGARAWPVPRHARPAIKNAGGPFSAPDGAMDLVDLVVGSEGIFGLVTACALKLAPRPASYLDLFFSLPGEAAALTLYRHLAATLPGGLGSLTALEYFGVNCRRYMDHEGRLFHGSDPVGVYIQVPLPAQADAADAAQEWLERLARSACGVDEDAILLIDSDRDRTMFMEARHSLPARSLEVVQRRGTYTLMTDTVVPPARFAEFLDFTHGLLRAEGFDYLAFGHLGDCHLHVMILPEKEQLQRAADAYDRIVAKSADLGGVYSGEHGTGKRKRGDFLRCYGARGVEEVRRCKAAVDPRFLLNRGNVIEHAGV